MLKVKISQIIILVFLSSIFISAQNYQLVWSDEFTGREINEKVWTYEIGGHGWGNEEMQYYTNRDTNIFIEDGKLIIQALKEDYLGKKYTSARIKTQNKKIFMYGKIEAKIKLPYGKGMWPAFWMLGKNFSSVGWPACGEIDIMEMIGGTNNDNKVYGTIHWEHSGQHADFGGNYKLSTGIFADGFHTFSVEWTPKLIKWFVNGHLFHTVDITPSELSEFQQDFFIILNVAVGGTWPGSPDGSTVFPQRMEVDYVRVYQDASKFPTVNLLTPINNENYNEYDDIIITASIESAKETKKVEFYQDELKIGETSIEPFSMCWRNISSGNYKIKAVAETIDGYLGESEVVNISIGSGAEQYSYAGRPIKIPGIIEAENFDVGGNGISYKDITTGNEGALYRINEGVDIETCFDEYGEYNIGWTAEGEWITYTVDVKNTAEYELTARVASESSGGSFSIEIDNVSVATNISVPNTGDWQTWTSVTTNISLTKGIHKLRFVVNSGGFNLNRFEIYEPNTLPKISLIAPLGGEIFKSNSVQEILWEQLKINEITIGLSTDGGSNWSFLVKDLDARYGFYRWAVPEVMSEKCLIMIVDANLTSINDVTSVFTIDNVNAIEDENPKIGNEFSLLQNYPNPFNPSTKISYTIPNTTSGFNMSIITLKVYDILGNEIITLVNKQQRAGNYNVEFDGRDLPSGIYYYILKTDNFSQTRKMILMK